MGGNKDNMRQAMKELLGLVGFGPEDMEQQAESKPVERPVTAERPATVEQPVAQEKTERPVVQERPPVKETPKAPEEPVLKGPFSIEREPAVEVSEPVSKQPPAAEEPTDLEDTRRRVASTVERSFFPFGRTRGKEKERVSEPAPVFDRPTDTPPVEEIHVKDFRAEEFPTVEDTTFRPPFIRPGATVIAAGATFFGDIRAEGDVEVLGKVKGNLEATGNVRILGKVLGDVKGESVKLEGCTVQGNITSTSVVSLDAGAMVVGDVLATDFESDGKVKGNLQIARAANFSACALLAGNVIAATIMMAQGAKVQGTVRIAEDPEANALFGELEI